MLWTSFFCAVGGLTTIIWLGGCSKKASPDRPNVILITVDTLRPDHLGCYGYSKNTSPNIDMFARDAMLFEKCYSHAPNTWASITSLLSGFLPHETGVLLDRPVPHALLMLQEILKEAGYATVAVVSNFVLRKGRGYEQGFDEYDATMSRKEITRHVTERVAVDTTDRAIDLLQRYRKKRMFFWIHYQDPHGPYTPPQPYAGMFTSALTNDSRNLAVNTTDSGYRGIPRYQQLGTHSNYAFYVSQYDAETRYMDEHFKRLIDAIKTLGLYDDAIIIFSSDHGEGMGEQDYFFAHGERLHASQIRVPLIVKHGDRFSGRRTDFVQHIDIVPTLLKMLSLKGHLRLRGRDVRAPQSDTREIFSEMATMTTTNRVDSSLIYDGLKMIYLADPYEPDGEDHYQLYDLRSDSLEQRNLIEDATYQQQTKDLEERLFRIRSEDFLGIALPVSANTLTEDEKRKLEALGYSK